MKYMIVPLLAFVFSPFVFGESASACALPGFFSANNVTELRYREWGALKGPVKTVALEFALRRAEFSLYNSKDLERGGVPDKVGRFTVERRALLARDEDGAGYAFSEWDVETVASANVFVFSGLASEKALFEAARKRNRALWPKILHPGQSELCYNVSR